MEKQNEELKEARRANNITILGLIVAIATCIGTLILTQKSLDTARDNTIAAQKSADVAQEALKMQREEMEADAAQEKQKAIDEAAKNAKFIELSQEQINAMIQQASSIKRSAQHDEFTQKPIVDGENGGFFLQDDGSVIFSLRIKNLGGRVAFLRKIVLVVMNKNYEIINGLGPIPNMQITPNSSFLYKPKININGVSKSFIKIDELLGFGDIFFYLQFEYSDPYKSESEVIRTTPKFLKFWRDSAADGLATKVDDQLYYPLVLCNKSEVNQMMEVINKTRIIQ